VAAKNEAANLPQLIDEIATVLRSLCRMRGSGLAEFEVVVVDDGSTDETERTLSRLSECYPELRWVTLATTSGQSAATIAGIHASRGNWIATLDADLQNDPADLVHLWRALPGYDAALGWRTVRKDTIAKRVISTWANHIRNLVLSQSIRDTGCSVRIFSLASALQLPRFHGMHRFVGPLLLREGYKLVQVPVKHRHRASGRSHYNLWNRSLSVLIDLLGVVWLMRRPVQFRVIASHWSRNSIDRPRHESALGTTAGRDGQAMGLVVYSRNLMLLSNVTESRVARRRRAQCQELA
jgi:glycosyltransferase involved in cell wall biosynthesis